MLLTADRRYWQTVFRPISNKEISGWTIDQPSLRLSCAYLSSASMLSLLRSWSLADVRVHWGQTSLKSFVTHHRTVQWGKPTFCRQNSHEGLFVSSFTISWGDVSVEESFLTDARRKCSLQPIHGNLFLSSRIYLATSSIFYLPGFSAFFSQVYIWVILVSIHIVFFCWRV